MTGVIDSAIRFVIIATVIGVAAFLVFYLAIVPNITNDDKTQEPRFSERLDEGEKKVLDFIQSYEGKDGSGLTLSEAVAMAVLVAYPNEKILDNPSTKFGWYAVPESALEMDKRWDATFHLKTYKEDTSFEWIVDMETKTVYPKNENGKGILDLLND